MRCKFVTQVTERVNPPRFHGSNNGRPPLPPTKVRVAMKLIINASKLGRGLPIMFGQGTSYHVRGQGPQWKGAPMAGDGVLAGVAMKPV